MKQKTGIPTLDQYAGGKISQTAAHYWSRDNPSSCAFESQIIEQIYVHEILGTNFSIRNVMVLEFSQYLENYLWPNFAADKCSTRHLLSIVIMVNEKFRERVPAWEHFVSIPDQFPGFFRKVCELILDNSETSLREQAMLIKFINHCFSSVEVPLIREQIQKYVSLPIWECLLPAKRDAIFKSCTKLGKYWKALQKQDSKRMSEELLMLSFERRFLHNLIQKFLLILDTIPLEGVIDRWKLQFCERFMELMIDLESLPPTRRFFNALLHNSHVITYSRMSKLSRRKEEGHLFRQLLDMLIFYSKFEISDLSGEPLSEDDMTDIHYDRISNLQKAAFKYFKDELKEFYLLNVASVDRRSDLMKYFSSLSKEHLYQVAEFLHLMPPRVDMNDTDFDTLTDKFLLELLVSTHERKSSQLEALNEMPLYPTEKIIWDENVVPNEFYSGEGTLALNKLNLQFLTLHDYLLRNFNLFRLESTYEVRGDLEDAIFRMKPWLHEDKSRVIFGGWARMALPINNFSIFEVAKPNIGEKASSSVRADVSVTLNLRQEVKTEWENLRRHDVCLLIGLKPEKPFGTKYDVSKKFLDQITVTHVRGCEIEGMLDQEGNVIEEWVDPKPEQPGDTRTWRIKLDTNQYRLDLENVVKGGEDVYGSFNVLMRRRPKENNFKAVLETIRQLMNTHCVVPDWLQDLILGYGDPAAAHYTKMQNSIAHLDFFDTFLSFEHAKASFPDCNVVSSVAVIETAVEPPFKLTFCDLERSEDEEIETVRGEKMDTSESAQVEGNDPLASTSKIIVEPYVIPSRGPYLYNKPRQNAIRFTPVQTEAVKSGMQPGLTMVVGPPGTGKTDVAVQIISNIYHNWPDQRTLIVTHSNQALNQLFEKCMALDIDERHLLRLGHGEEALETEKDFSRYGRVNYVLKQRLRLLKEVNRLQSSLGVAGDVSYTCETAGHFYMYQVLARWEKFLSHTRMKKEEKTCADIAEHFPFFDYFANAPQPLFKGRNFEEDMEIAEGCWRHLSHVFKQLDEFRAFELLRSGRDRTEYLLVKEAKVIAMTCTHAALRRRDMVQLGFKFDNILMEEAAQILEIETFIPLLLQDPLDGHNRLKRWIMIGDHHQLPPVIKNLAFQKFSNMEQSLFARFVRLGVKTVQLDAQGRARPSIAELYNWRYRCLGNLDHVITGLEYRLCNPGFVFDYQVIDVGNFNGVGESAPTPYFYQNLAEAEYAVAIFMYMRLLGYPAEKITILTTYNGQKFLIRDVVNKRCATNPLIGEPHKIATVDKYQGQQNDYIILSLVRTHTVGHVRDVRRLVVALSRARLGLYVLARTSLFKNCFELRPAFNILLRRPTKLLVQPVEKWPPTRLLTEQSSKPPVEIQDMTHMAQFVYDFYNLHCEELQANIQYAALLQQKHEAEMARCKPYDEGGKVDPVPQSVSTEAGGKVDGKAAEKDIEFEILAE